LSFNANGPLHNEKLLNQYTTHSISYKTLIFSLMYLNISFDTHLNCSKWVMN
jgi:hypothetical protein